MGARIVSGSGDWALRRAPSRRRRGSGSARVALPEEFLQTDGVSVDQTLEAELAPSVRRGATKDLELEIEHEPGTALVLAVRHPSGALTFHRASGGLATSARRGASRVPVARFRLPVRAGEASGSRRGLVTTVVKLVVVKLAKAVVEAGVKALLPKLAALWEKRTWEKKGLGEGWFRVARQGGKSPRLVLTAETPEPQKRSLLLLHGTFSSSAVAFGGLARTDFFDRVRPLYGDRIYAFDHFSISRTPEENAEALLAALSDDEHPFDAVTHSRGGLVLRSAVEQREAHGALARRLKLGHAVLVASPNEGTPLATPKRWEETIGWVANLLELFPENPFTTGAEFVSEALLWLATHLTGDLPGLRAMDANGDTVAELQEPPGPPEGAYSALVSSFDPDAALVQRALDVGVDQFFGSANDLVVPSEGGWRMEREGTPAVPSDRIGCFGPGGNLESAAPVHHMSFFGRAETARFLVEALSGQPHHLRAIDPSVALPHRRFLRGPAARDLRLPPAAATFEESRLRPAPALAGAPSRPVERDRDVDTFHLVIMDGFDGSDHADKPGDKERFARLFASYGGARVVEPLQLRKTKEKSSSFGEIIKIHEQIKNYTNREKGELPDDEGMKTFGGLLFETLFPGDVRRLYDEARSRQGTKLDFVLTSMIPWIADKPWEFAYDTARKRFLATEEIQFVRNVLTAIPADPVIERPGPLRILVASAQPVGSVKLSHEQEERVIRRGFEPLVEAGLAQVDVLARATPAALHGHLSTGDYGVVHFIGHGEFDENLGEGFLLFEDDRGGAIRLPERSVREIFCQRGVSLAFLNACQTGTGGRADFNKGVAQSLVAHGLPAVVANQYSVLDSSATSFAQHFYWALGQGSSFGDAAREARIAVNYSLQGDIIDWAVPVCYARDPNQVLCPKPSGVRQVPATAVRGTSRRATERHSRRVAVWDVDHVFPDLDDTLAKLNAAQAVFGCELADLSAPLDAWNLKRNRQRPYLVAERLAERLSSKSVELGVDLLVCITRHWLMDVDTLNLYAWWPGPKDLKKKVGRRQLTLGPVAVFSAAGFDALKVEGPSTKRAIANALVMILTGFFADEGTHEDGSKHCPLYYNAERSEALLTGPQAFDADCRSELEKKLTKKELAALDAMLTTFVTPPKARPREARPARGSRR